MCCKVLWHGASGFTSPPKEDVLQICIPFTNPLPLPGLNPWTFDPVASSLTITLPSRIKTYLSFAFFEFDPVWINNIVYFQVCATYPSAVVVPKSVDDNTIKAAASFREGGRFPVLSYRHDGGVSCKWSCNVNFTMQRQVCGASDIHMRP
jgi:hypothetical protein